MTLPWPRERAGEAGKWRLDMRRPLSGNLVRKRDNS